MDDDHNSQPLPTAFWKPVGEEEITPPVGQEDASTIEWKDSFSALGHNIHDALHQCLNTDSIYLKKPMRTIEDVYMHLKAVAEFNDAAAQPKTALTTKIAKSNAFETARAEWHEACTQRKAAVTAWDAYVLAKRQAMQALK